MNWTDFFGGFCWGVAIVIWILKTKFQVERKHKYKWSCLKEGCDFKVSTNDSYEAVLRIADSHMEVSHYD